MIVDYQSSVPESNKNNNTAYRYIRVDPKKYTLAVNTYGSGKVTSSPSGISCGSSCSKEYDEDTTVKLTASPSSGYKFTGWSACSGTDSCSVKMSSKKSVTARFEEIEYECGTFGVWNNQSYTSRYWNGSDDRNEWKYTPSWQEDSEHCYEYYTLTEFHENGWGTADSYRLWAKTSWDEKYSSCSTYTVHSVKTITERHKGKAGYGYYGAGKVVDYGDGSCSGNSPLNDLEGTITVRFYYRIAPLIPK